MKTFIVFLILLSVISCQRIPIDSTPAPIDNNLKTMEIGLCGQKSLGLAGCAYNSQTNLESLTFEFPLFHRGYYTLMSEGCDFYYKTSFKGNFIKRFSLSQLLEKKPSDRITCTFDLLVKIDGFDKSFSARFLITDREEFSAAQAKMWGQDFTQGVGWFQVRQNSSLDTKLEFKTQGEGKLLFQGCGHKGTIPFTKTLAVSLRDLLGKDEVWAGDSCQYSMYIVPKDGTPPQAFMFILGIFSKDVVPLPEPFITQKGKRLCADMDKSQPVGVLSIDQKAKISHNKLCVNVSSTPSWVRVGTANGRSLLLGVKHGEVVWRSLIKF